MGICQPLAVGFFGRQILHLVPFELSRAGCMVVAGFAPDEEAAFGLLPLIMVGVFVVAFSSLVILHQVRECAHYDG